MWTWKLETPAMVPGRGPDLGRVVRQRRQVVAERGAHVGEPVTDELHAVARVAGESNHHPVEHLGLAGRRMPLLSLRLTLPPCFVCAGNVVAPTGAGATVIGASPVDPG